MLIVLLDKLLLAFVLAIITITFFTTTIFSYCLLPLHAINQQPKVIDRVINRLSILIAHDQLVVDLVIISLLLSPILLQELLLVYRPMQPLEQLLDVTSHWDVLQHCSCH